MAASARESRKRRVAKTTLRRRTTANLQRPRTKLYAAALISPYHTTQTTTVWRGYSTWYIPTFFLMV